MNTEWAEQWVANFDDPDKLIEMYNEDVQFEDVVFAHKETSQAGLARFFSSFGGSDAGEHVFALVGYSGGPDAGAVEWSWQAKHARDFLGVPAKGKRTDVSGVSVLTFRNGKIASQRDLWDAAAALRQLGAVK